MTANGKVDRVKMHVKKGDTVQVVAGDDKGKVGEVVEVRIGNRALADIRKLAHAPPLPAQNSDLFAARGSYAPAPLPEKFCVSCLTPSSTWG